MFSSFFNKLLTITANFEAICSFPDEFRWRPCFVKHSLLRSVSKILTLLNVFILLFNCRLNLTTLLFTQEEEIRSYLGGADITTIFTFCLFSTKLHKCLRASWELFFPMSVDPPPRYHNIVTFELSYFFFHRTCYHTHSRTWFYVA